MVYYCSAIIAPPPPPRSPFTPHLLLIMDSLKDIYRDFALVATPTRVVPSLDAFAFSVRATQSGVSLPWFECEADEMSQESSEAVHLFFLAAAAEKLTFDEDDYYSYPDDFEAMATDLRSRRCKIVAVYDNLDHYDDDKEKGEIIQGQECYLIRTMYNV